MPSDESTSPANHHADLHPTADEPEQPCIYYDLNDWTEERCDHAGVIPPLPNLRCTISDDDWSHLSLHWTAAGWALCEQPAPKPQGEPTTGTDRLIALTERALRESNKTPRNEWLEIHLNAIRRSIERSKARASWAGRHLRESESALRQADCAMAIAKETDIRAAAIAQRLQPTWTASAGALMAVARDLAGHANRVDER